MCAFVKSMSIPDQKHLNVIVVILEFHVPLVASSEGLQTFIFL